MLRNKYSQFYKKKLQIILQIVGRILDKKWWKMKQIRELDMYQ